MVKAELEKLLHKLLTENNLKDKKSPKLIVLTGLLGDFDSFEYAINLAKFLNNNELNTFLEILFIAIGSKSGKKKFCEFTKFPNDKLIVVKDNKLHDLLQTSRGLDVGLGGWINIFLMLTGIGSQNTIREVIRGYIGDKDSKQIYSDNDKINLLNNFSFSGKLFKKSFGNGYLRPFELATFRLSNMIEILKNWNVYMINSEYLPQRGGTFLLDGENNLIFSYKANDILNYSKNMQYPLEFLELNLKK